MEILNQWLAANKMFVVSALLVFWVVKLAWNNRNTQWAQFRHQMIMFTTQSVVIGVGLLMFLNWLVPMVQANLAASPVIAGLGQVASNTGTAIQALVAPGPVQVDSMQQPVANTSAPVVPVAPMTISAAGSELLNGLQGAASSLMQAPLAPQLSAPSGEPTPISNPASGWTQAPQQTFGAVATPPSPTAGVRPITMPAGYLKPRQQGPVIEMQERAPQPVQNIWGNGKPLNPFAAYGEDKGSGGPIVHKVARGESMYSIAKQYGVSALDLCALNTAVVKNRCDLLRVNMELIIP